MKNKVNIQKSKDFKGSLKGIILSLGKYKKYIFIVILLSILSCIFSIVSPKILGNATQELYVGIMNKLSNTGSINFNKINSILLTCLILYIISALLSYLCSYVMTNISQKYTYDLRNKISDKIHKLPFKYFDNKNNGEVLSIITNDVDTLQVSLNNSLTQLITSIVTVIGILIMMLSINVVMSLISLLLIPIGGMLMGIIVKKSQKHFKNNQEYLAKVNGNVEEMFYGQKVIKAYNAKEDKMIDFKKNNKELYEANFKSGFFSGLMHPIMMFVGNINYVMVAILGGYYASKGIITVGNIQSFISYSKNFTQPIMQVTQVFNQVQSCVAAYERINEFLNEEEEVNPTKRLDVSKLEGNVEFNNVQFGYNEKIIIKDFNININKGEHVAIVGPTGAGKSTLVKLLMHFYKLNNGSIKIDGNNIDEYNLSDIRNIFGMVLQDTWLTSGTIMENLKYGNPSVTDEEVYEVCKMCNIDHFINSLKDKYNTVINEDVSNISQGQKQLLTIARTILADNKILILDEATSSVDTRTEENIQNALDKLTKNKTTFIIAHRLSTIVNADVILVINDGDIVEASNHKELLEKKGFYYNLYNSQFEN